MDSNPGAHDAQAADYAARGRPRAASAQDRKRHLLESAEALFLTAGYHATTMDDVARGAGMSKRTVYQVFGSKAELFEALLDDRFGPFTLPFRDDGRSLAEQLAALLRQLATICLSQQKLAMTRLMIAEAALSRDMADALERLGIGRGAGPLERWLGVQVERGLLKGAVVRESRNALFFLAFGEAMLHTLLRIDALPDAAEIERRIAYAVRVFLNDAAV